MANVSRFDRGSVQDYDAMVAKLADVGTTIAAQRQREQHVASLNRDAEALSKGLDAFVTRAHQVEESSRWMVVFYARAMSVEQTNLARAQQRGRTAYTTC